MSIHDYELLVKLNGAYYVTVESSTKRVLVVGIRETSEPIYDVMDLVTGDQFEIHLDQFQEAIASERQFK